MIGGFASAGHLSMDFFEEVRERAMPNIVEEATEADDVSVSVRQPDLTGEHVGYMHRSEGVSEPSVSCGRVDVVCE